MNTKQQHDSWVYAMAAVAALGLGLTLGAPARAASGGLPACQTALSTWGTCKTLK